MRHSKTSVRGLRTAAGAGLVAVLLAACGAGGQEAAATPDGWTTLDTERLTVAAPGGFVEGAGEQSTPYEVARAVKEDGGTTVAALYVEFDYGKGLTDAKMAAVGAEARIQMGATPAKSSEIQVQGADGPVEARRIDYSFTSQGDKKTLPKKGTEVKGTMLAGVDAERRPYLITVNATKGLVSEKDLQSIVDSLRLA